MGPKHRGREGMRALGNSELAPQIRGAIPPISGDNDNGKGIKLIDVSSEVYSDFILSHKTLLNHHVSFD